MTIKQQAEELLTEFQWTYDDKRRSPAWTHPKHPGLGIYLGNRGSIRIGKSKTDSRPVGGNGHMLSLTWLVERTEKLPEPTPPPAIDKQPNPLTELRRQAHAIVQTLDLDQCNELVRLWNVGQLAKMLTRNDLPRLQTDANHI